jgi:hypothetical protein
VDDLVQPFRDNVNAFLSALDDAGATVAIADTFRPPQRAYLMHFCFLIASGVIDPAKVEPIPGVDIQWVHLDTQGNPDPAASKAAAQQMVAAYGIAFETVLVSRQTQRLAIDMDITWQGDLTIADASGTQNTITSVPRSGAGNADLHRVGASFGVTKLLTDPPHWSSDGH